MRANRLNLIVLALASTLIFSCKKETEEFISEPLSDYMPVQTGKYITYRLDSTVFTNFGRNTEIRSFQEKHLVDALVTDALGRPAYRILRFTRDTLGTTAWAPAGTYLVVPQQKTVELVENNLRFVWLALPIKQDFSWKPNRFLPDEPFSSLFSFQNDLDMVDWDFNYSATAESVEINGQVYDSVITVDGIDRSANVPVADLNSYGYIDYQQLKYAKGIGLIYEEWIMWDYQPPAGGSGSTGYKTGFAVKRSIIDHN